MKSVVFCVVSFTLLCSFLFHAVQVYHEHHGADHNHKSTLVTILGEAMHAIEKKLFVYALAPLYTPDVLLTMLLLMHIYRTFLCMPYARMRLSHNLFDAYVQLLRIGILHPKTF